MEKEVWNGKGLVIREVGEEEEVEGLDGEGLVGMEGQEWIGVGDWKEVEVVGDWREVEVVGVVEQVHLVGLG